MISGKNIDASTAENTLTKVEINGEVFYKMSHVNNMRPFFITVVSNSDHWLFVTSNGGISAGRKNADFALFPYYTDDKITDSAETTGSKTILQIYNNGRHYTWEPFSVRSESNYSITRNLYQNTFSNKIIFEEINHDLGLQFQYEWNTSDRFGFVKKSRLLNTGNLELQVEVLDGIQNILPYGVPGDLQTKTSNLANAYKRAELVSETGLGIFALSAFISDKAAPAEALKANAVWSLGLEQPAYLLSSLQLDLFRNRMPVTREEDVKGEKGAYFALSTVNLPAFSEKRWLFIANLNLDHADVVQLNESIKREKALIQKIEQDIDQGTADLVGLCASSDGLQCTDDELKDTRHFSNVLFNIMRGGIFDNNYQVEKQDFKKYIRKANQHVFEKVGTALDACADVFKRDDLKKLASSTGNINFSRLATEYLPLKFSRRHGDPSRPWNHFSINIKNPEDGSKILDYQGNWRDIFQNWEALAHAYPSFVDGMICKFLNASTFDGYNPYRVTKDGFEWETIEPDNPWSYIGYWGDHQVIYLLKLLELAEKHQPGTMNNLLGRQDFVYANVPYQIKDYNSIVRDPKNTIEFDQAGEKLIHKRIASFGADGALLTNANDEIYHVGFLEKILATLLSKLSNFVPEGGIWMNTQRPEWNDANNALVGNGLSVVTLCYLRRFLKFFQAVCKNSKQRDFPVSKELHSFFTELSKVFNDHVPFLSLQFEDNTRKQLTDALGSAGSKYRTHIYTNRFSGKKEELPINDLVLFLDTTLLFLEHSIRVNARPDKLYHAYNLLNHNGEGFSISRLDEMLEGQVAVLSSGCLTAAETLQLLDALRKSKLYSADQDSYILYPNKNLPGFLQRNNIPKIAVESSPLLLRLLKDTNTSLVEKDVNGEYHFNGNFKNADDLIEALAGLETSYQAMVTVEKNSILQIFDDVFNHKKFTGRSGTFYGYEGLGSIYWHMVSKLLLAVQEVCITAIRENESEDIINSLVNHYYQISEGIGVHKTPCQYGAFSFTPYSHTPFNKGAQQPGMTGQVKEDILCRLGELGVSVEMGQLKFYPQILRRAEFLKEDKKIILTDINNKKQEVTVSKNTLLFTYCQVPVVYCIGDAETITVRKSDGTREVYNGSILNASTTTAVFNRAGLVEQITVSVKETNLVK